MLNLDQYAKQIKTFQDKFGSDVILGEQGSEAWLQSRLGVITASNASKVVAKVDSETRKTYMLELVAQIATGVTEELNTKYTEWGKLHEESCRSTYEFENDVEIQQVGFIFKDDSFREGVSVDGLAKYPFGLVPTEFKCPYNTVHYLKFILDSKIKKEYEWQCQFGMRVIDSDLYHVSQYDPRMRVKPFGTIIFEKDEKAQATLNDAVPQFISDMDKLLSELGVSFGSQWRETKK